MKSWWCTSILTADRLSDSSVCLEVSACLTNLSLTRSRFGLGWRIGLVLSLRFGLGGGVGLQGRLCGIEESLRKSVVLDCGVDDIIRKSEALD